MKVTIYTNDGNKTEVEADSVICVRPDVVRYKHILKEGKWSDNVVAVEVTEK